MATKFKQVLFLLFVNCFIIFTYESVIEISRYESVEPSGAFTVLQPLNLTRRGLLGCALICFRVPSEMCTGFVFVGENGTCSTLTGVIDGTPGLGGPVYRKKIVPATTTPQPPTTTTASTTTAPSTAVPTTAAPTTAAPSTVAPTTASPPTAMITTAPQPPPTTHAPTCPPSFTIYNTYCFRFIFRKNGPSSKSICEGYEPNSYLAYVNTMAKLNTVKDFIVSNLPPNEYYETYLGIRRRSPGGLFQYDANDVSIPNNHHLWTHAGYPNPTPSMSYGCSGKSNNLWNNDGSGEWSYHSVCEILLA